MMESLGTSASLIGVGISVAALLIAGASLWFSQRNWRQSNRPIVTAFVAEACEDSMHGTFDMVISNSGTRPATKVRLMAAAEDIEKLIEPGAADHIAHEVRMCFSESACIPLLRNGEELRTALGFYYGDDDDLARGLNYGAEIKITVIYGDIEGKQYKSHMPLKIFSRRGFAGASWQRTRKTAMS